MPCSRQRAGEAKRMMRPLCFDAVEPMIEEVIARVGPRIVLGIPLGIGKPNQFVNALYRHVQADPALHLTIISALSMEKPKGGSELESRFLDPFVARVFGDYPDLEYIVARRNGTLPPNVRVIEQFLKTGAFLDNDAAQQEYLYVNYTNVARDLLIQGVNVLAQAVAVDDGMAEDGMATGPLRLSMSCNPDITPEVMDLLAQHPEHKVLMIACQNRRLPFMENGAVLSPGAFDLMLTDPRGTHDLFAAPNMKVSLQDYAIGLYTSALVRDGGTLQIGIGSLGDAISHALLLRDRDNAGYCSVLDDLLDGALAPALAPLLDTRPFAQGLYGCSEMFVNGFLRMINAGLIRREVFEHEGLQQLLNQNRIGYEVSPATLQAVLDAGIIAPALRVQDVAFLIRFGIFRADVTLHGAQLQTGSLQMGADLGDPATMLLVCAHCLGSRLQGGVFMHGGFFLGPRDFYQGLRDMQEVNRHKISMSRIGFVNRLGDEVRLRRLQRRDARFINTTMVVSLLGAASSDSLDSGRVVSGVGGQFNFVNMADQLPDARSILMLRSTHSSKGKTWSNIVWSYAQTTIPRHLRDIVITEYGIADLRGQLDNECVKRMLAIADSRYQDDLMQEAKRNGKLEAGYRIPERYRHNTPQQIESRLRTWRDRGLLPDFPFGTDFTADELVIVRALRKLKDNSHHPLELAKMLWHSLGEEGEMPARYLARMGLDHPDLEGMKMRLLRRLFIGNLG